MVLSISIFSGVSEERVQLIIVEDTVLPSPQPETGGRQTTYVPQGGMYEFSCSGYGKFKLVYIIGVLPS